MTDMPLSMVLPSLVMMVSPLPLLIILSMPLGPREVRIASATAADKASLANRGHRGVVVEGLTHTSGSDNVGRSHSHRLLFILVHENRQ